jgi:hypothetical protein
MTKICLIDLQKNPRSGSVLLLIETKGGYPKSDIWQIPFDRKVLKKRKICQKSDLN